MHQSPDDTYTYNRAAPSQCSVALPLNTFDNKPNTPEPDDKDNLKTISKTIRLLPIHDLLSPSITVIGHTVRRVTWSQNCSPHFCSFRLPNMLPTKVPHLMTLADLSPAQIYRILQHSHQLKKRSLPWLAPLVTGAKNNRKNLRLPTPSLFGKSIALLFSKRSTRTRLAAETSASLLGGNALFLGKEDIQLGVNENARDSARVIGGMCQGIFARVGEHQEIEVCYVLYISRPR